MTELHLIEGTLFKITGFFRNDKPGGLGFSFGGSASELAETANEIGKAIKHFSSQCSDDDLLEWLEDAAQRRATLTDRERIAAMAMISILVDHTAIKSDEYNGTVYFVLKDRTMVCYEDLPLCTSTKVH